MQMMKKPEYHHGNLRSALISAGIDLLDEVGWTGLSLRACAAKAGVSHAAPAHHFGNLNGLLTALAAVALTRFVTALSDAMADTPDDPPVMLDTVGRAYVQFAIDNPGLFKLMFDEVDLDHCDPDLTTARNGAFAILGEITAPFLPPGADQQQDYKLRTAIWSSVHGYAQLLLARQLTPLQDPEDPFMLMPDLLKLVPELK